MQQDRKEIRVSETRGEKSKILLKIALMRGSVKSVKWHHRYILARETSLEQDGGDTGDGEQWQRDGSAKSGTIISWG